MSLKDCFIACFEATFADSCQLGFEESFPEGADLIGEQDAVEMVVFVLDYSCLVAVVNLVMELSFFVIVSDPYAGFTADLFPDIRNAEAPLSHHFKLARSF